MFVKVTVTVDSSCSKVYITGVCESIAAELLSFKNGLIPLIKYKTDSILPSSVYNG